MGVEPVARQAQRVVACREQFVQRALQTPGVGLRAAKVQGLRAQGLRVQGLRAQGLRTQGLRTKGLQAQEL